METDIFQLNASASGETGSGTSKPSRTQTVSVRLDPKLRYLCEIGARRQRRNLSSFIEWALESSLNDLSLTDVYGNTSSLGSVAFQLWDIEAPDRFAKLALRYPDLLNQYEELLWKIIREASWLWKGHYPEKSTKWAWTVDEGSLIFARLRDRWDLINRIARGEADRNEKTLRVVERELPKPIPEAVPPMDDEDIPL